MREGRSGHWRSAISMALVALAASACVSVDDSATGSEIYDQICSRCHGSQLEGGVGPALGAGSAAADRDDEYWTQTITRGRGRMPAFRSTLTDEQIQRVIDFAREQQGQ